MKNLKSSAHGGKRFVLSSLISLFVFCASTASAQESNRQPNSPAEMPTESVQMPDAETLFEQNRFSEALDDSPAKNRLDVFLPARADGKNHGIIEISLSKTAIEKSETNHELSVAPKFEPKDKEIFFPADDSSLDHQTKVNFKAQTLLDGDAKSPFTRQTPAAGKFAEIKDFSDDLPPLNSPKSPADDGFRWRPAIQQALLFLAVQHGYAMTQPKTREALKGRFFHDYFKSVKSLRGWDDGGRFFTNYLAHPMQGSFVGFIQIQNDPKGIKQRFGSSGDYWRSRMKAMAWSAAWSTQFEIGPISQASIGNVGLKGKQTWEDIIITPTVGTAMLITEDALDRYVIERIERSSDSFYLRIFSRMLLNPTRTVANLIRFKHPWYRDRAIAR